MESTFAQGGCFTSLYTLRGNGQRVHDRLIGLEVDLNHFPRQIVKDRMSLIIGQLHEDSEPRARFRLRGPVGFENHGNTLSREGLEEEMT